MALEALSSTAHRHLRHQNPSQPFAFARQRALSPLVAAEVAVALRWMPVAFGIHEGKASLQGLMGLSADENLFVDLQGQWRGNYIPAAFRAVPFGVAPRADGGEQTVVIDPTAAISARPAARRCLTRPAGRANFCKRYWVF